MEQSCRSVSRGPPLSILSARHSRSHKCIDCSRLYDFEVKERLADLKSLVNGLDMEKSHAGLNLHLTIGMRLRGHMEETIPTHDDPAKWEFGSAAFPQWLPGEAYIGSSWSSVSAPQD